MVEAVDIYSDVDAQQIPRRWMSKQDLSPVMSNIPATFSHHISPKLSIS